LADSENKIKSEFTHTEDICVSLSVIVPEWNEFIELSLRLNDRNKLPVFTIHEPVRRNNGGSIELEYIVKIPGNFLAPGNYSWNICMHHPMVNIFDMHEDVLQFDIIDVGSKFAQYSGQNYGNVFPPYTILNK
jgi:lipopolysaccharide transport system ATP-binding protein